MQANSLDHAARGRMMRRRNKPVSLSQRLPAHNFLADLHHRPRGTPDILRQRHHQPRRKRQTGDRHRRRILVLRRVNAPREGLAAKKVGQLHRGLSCNSRRAPAVGPARLGRVPRCAGMQASAGHFSALFTMSANFPPLGLITTALRSALVAKTRGKSDAIAAARTLGRLHPARLIVPQSAVGGRRVAAVGGVAAAGACRKRGAHCGSRRHAR